MSVTTRDYPAKKNGGRRAASVEADMAIQLSSRADAFIVPDAHMRCKVIEHPDLSRPDAIHAVVIGLNRTPEDTDVQIEVPVRIILGRGFEGLAAEEHIARFNASEWTEIASWVDRGLSVKLTDAIVVYDDMHPKTVIDTTCHVDLGDEFGYEDGIYKEYIKGWIRDVRSVEVTKDVFSSDKEIAQIGSLMSADDLVEMEHMSLETPLYDDEEFCDYYDDMPSLSDFYDDLEELELNTRGDGYD